MSAMRRPLGAVSALGFLLSALVCSALPLAAQQAVDEEYTAKIREYLRDPRITTELVDHLPASSTVPTPLKFLGRIPGTPGELTYARDIHRYFRALDEASDRVLTWSIGTTEEGREQIVLAVADEATIRDLQRYRGMLNALGDPRKLSDEEARRLIGQAKPIYWFTAGLHSPENGPPEMVVEMAYRLAVSESPFIRNIRENVITFITPVLEVDGREKQVDTYYFNKARPTGTQRLPLMYWGKYVAHDNNRDGLGHVLALTRNVNRFWLEWTPTIMHDLHESATYLYSSTGTGPYNEALDPIVVSEWWTLAQNDVLELTRRGVPGVWTYGFYDGWTPNYLFYVAHARNGTGRFYETQSYGPDNYVVRPGSTTTSREWFRPNPPLDSINWGPRNNVNIMQSGALVSLSHVARNREMWVENWYLKNKRSVEKGRNGPVFGWVIPAGQRRKSEAAEAVNALRRQGLEFHVADRDFAAGAVQVKAGDWIIRADQPNRTLADMYFSVQSFAPANPRPYDDTGWTWHYLRNVVVRELRDRGALDQRMTALAADARAAGGIEGSGPVVVVDHTGDNSLVVFRYRFADVRMDAARDDFEAGGRKFRAGAFIIPNADRARLDPVLRELGLTGVAMARRPDVASHELDLPRIGYVHAWQNTQNEGWVRAAFDQFGIPYTYFADQKLREGNLRARYDVIVFPHVGGSAQAQVNGIAKIDTMPLPYRKTDAFANLGAQDQSDDIRGGMGLEGLAELRKFVEEGGTLITEGSTATIFPEYSLTSGVTVENPSGLFLRGSVVRGVVADRKHPIAYGYDAQVPVYFNQAPVLAVSAGGGGFGGFGGGAGAPQGQNITPMASPVRLSPWQQEGDPAPAAAPQRPAPAPAAGGGGGGGGFGGQAQGPTGPRPRAVVRFPANAADILLSGTLAGGEALTNRAAIVDAPVGKGHVVMFAIRPFWRGQTHGTYFFGFNAILNWNDLDAGQAGAAAAVAAGGNGN